MAKGRVNFPNFILTGATKLVKSTIKIKPKFNLNRIVPVLFYLTKNDTFVDKYCKDLYNIYVSVKNIIYVDGNNKLWI